MSMFGFTMFVGCLAIAFGSTRWIAAPWGWIVALAAFVVGIFGLIAREPRRTFVAALKGLTWRRSQFCRGWLITGDTGSGKTSSGINQLAHQVFRNEPRWGGLCIDEKGVYWETLKAMADHYGRTHDPSIFRFDQTTPAQSGPASTSLNLTGNRDIPFNTYAKFVVDTATSLGQGGDKGFFKSQAQTHIAHALELLHEIKRPVTLSGAFELLSSAEQLDAEIQSLRELHPFPRRIELAAHFTNRFLTQPAEQLGGVRETIGNYLQYYLSPEIAEVFCSPGSTFNMADVDAGKIICVTMPQKFQIERRYVNTFLKLLFYNHALRRFDKPGTDRADDNLIILWADEAQRFMTASEDGTSDYNVVDVIREAGATIIAAAQSTTSLVPPLGHDKAKVLTLNLRNRMVFRAADEADAVQTADFLGKKRVVKRSWGYSAGKRNVNYSETEEHKLKPHQLRNLRDHECVLVHCERGFRRVTLPPLEPNGRIAKWFSWWRRIA
ncbi:MAG: type IV secretion system DNA-binding domain-containing protein [Verrucomicrobia bacterium]|nr:type IV secretion system DNA-binding domain-containing protein [Verrucomicrobiota bacterium]